MTCLSYITTNKIQRRRANISSSQKVIKRVYYSKSYQDGSGHLLFSVQAVPRNEDDMSPDRTSQFSQYSLLWSVHCRHHSIFLYLQLLLADQNKQSYMCTFAVIYSLENWQRIVLLGIEKTALLSQSQIIQSHKKHCNLRQGPVGMCETQLSLPNVLYCVNRLYPPPPTCWPYIQGELSYRYVLSAEEQFLRAQSVAATRSCDTLHRHHLHHQQFHLPSSSNPDIE